MSTKERFVDMGGFDEGVGKACGIEVGAATVGIVEE